MATETMQHELFSGEERKEAGIKRAMSPAGRKNMMIHARRIARMIGTSQGEVTADDVVRYFDVRGIDLPAILGKAMGGLFRTEEFVPTGEYRPSTRPERHASVSRVWRVRN